LARLRQGSIPSGHQRSSNRPASFDAVDTCVCHIESCFAIGNMKAKMWRRFTDENERHDAYTRLARYSAIGQIMGGGIPKIPTVAILPDASA
ncbi:MAG: hypothetical protein MP439_03295, partial [Ferrimicrobium sp.]|nr:hypothetical protein [Ferrimicrobium sp.]